MHRLFDTYNSDVVMNEHLTPLLSYNVKSKSMQKDEVLSIWVREFIICFVPSWKVTFAILESLPVVLLFSLHLVIYTALQFYRSFSWFSFKSNTFIQITNRKWFQRQWIIIVYTYTSSFAIGWVVCSDEDITPNF